MTVRRMWIRWWSRIFRLSAIPPSWTDGGKYGKGILDSCRVKFIMQMEEQEARLVQEKLNLTEEELDRRKGRSGQ